MCAYWNGKLRYKYIPGKPITCGGGENTSLPINEIASNESSYSRNLTSDKYPALTVRYGKTKQFGTDAAVITTPNGLGQRNNQYPWIHDGTTVKRWDGSAWQNVHVNMANAQSKILEFNTESTRYTIFVDGTNRKSWDGSNPATITDAPATSLYTVDDYRLYALLGSVLKCSAVGSITDWTTVDDADSIAVTSMIGTGTAIETFNDTVICWSEQSMHILYGNDTGDFEWNKNPIESGCISDRSKVIYDGVLYYLDYGQYKAFTGGNPVNVSQKVKTYLDGINTTYKAKCVARQSGKYIYLSIPYGSGATTNNLTLEYNTELGIWYPHNVGFLDFVNINEYLYGVDTAGVIWKVNSGTDDGGTVITWEDITGFYTHDTITSKKTMSNLYASVDLPTGSTLILAYSPTMDGNDFVTLKTFTASSSEQNTKIDIPTSYFYDVDGYRLKFSGTGPCTIYYYQPVMRIKKG